MKRFLSLILTLVMAVATVGLVACKEDDGSGSQGGETAIEYTLDKENDYYVVSGYNLSNADAEKIADGDYEDIMKDITIPATYEGKAVKEIAQEAFLDQVIIKSVVIPSTIEKIGAGAFSGCINMEEIEIPFAGEKVGAVNEKKVFGYIFGTTSNDKATETSQVYNAGSSATTSYYIPTKLTKVTYTGAELSEYAFNACSTLKEIVLTKASEITEIPFATFNGCTGINEFTLPENVTVIGPEAFKGCSALINFTFNQKLEVISQSAFEGCTSLNTKADIQFPSTLKQIKAKAFMGCNGLIGIDVSTANGLELVGEASFNGCSALKKITLPTNPTGVTIASQAFVNCDKLTSQKLYNLSGNETKYILASDAFPYGFFN